MACVRSITARALEIPFKVAFAHASASRSLTQSVWVEAEDADGRIGCGEGCPREYVTGETLAGALDFVAATREALAREVGDLEALRGWVCTHETTIDAHPAAWCALELALLDLFGKQAGVSTEALLGLPPLAGVFRYTAVLGDSPPQRFAAELARYVQAGFRDFKVKLAGVHERDAGKMEALEAARVDRLRLRADANNLWADARQALAALHALPSLPFALEEPLRAGDLAGMADLAAELGCAIILDESAVRPAQIARLPQGPRWIVNLRISKMGGLLRSLALAQRAADASLALVIGAHVGETSVLTRAALTAAHAHRRIVIGQEGAFGTHLLERDVVAAPIMFGAGGMLDAASLPVGPGFGLVYR